MSERTRIDTRLKTLADIHEIMSALKNTALIESTRLRRFLPAQQRVVQSIETAVADFLSWHPEFTQGDFDSNPVFVVIGSERGFCGDYNEALLAPLVSALHKHGGIVIITGSRLATRASRQLKTDAMLEGPAVADEIGGVVERLVEVLRARQTKDSPFLPLALHVIHHEPDGHTTRIRHRRPFPTLSASEKPLATPLRTQLPPDRLFAALVEQYLFAVLHEIFSAALLAENERRLQHLEGAIRRIDHTRQDLGNRRNVLRQEEITEEIEVILLSTGALDAPDALAEVREWTNW